MTGTFDGFQYDEATSTYTWPSGTPDWADVSNQNADLYPIKFTEAGKITFTAAAHNGNVDVDSSLKGYLMTQRVMEMKVLYLIIRQLL